MVKPHNFFIIFGHDEDLTKVKFKHCGGVPVTSNSLKTILVFFFTVVFMRYFAAQKVTKVTKCTPTL